MEKQEKPVGTSVPLIYANGISVSLTITDIHLSATVNGRPACILAIPLPTAKSLINALQLAISDYEKLTNKEVYSLEELSNLMRKING